MGVRTKIQILCQSDDIAICFTAFRVECREIYGDRVMKMISNLCCTFLIVTNDGEKSTPVLFNRCR